MIHDFNSVQLSHETYCFWVSYMTQRAVNSKAYSKYMDNFTQCSAFHLHVFFLFHCYLWCAAREAKILKYISMTIPCQPTDDNQRKMDYEPLLITYHNTSVFFLIDLFCILNRLCTFRNLFQSEMPVSK